MSDFQPPPGEAEPEDDQPWLTAPEDELGVPVPLPRLVARTDDVAVALGDFSAYSTGLEFAVEVRLRRHDHPADPFGLWLDLRSATEVPDEVLRFGFELADGSRVTTVGDFPASEEAPARVLIQQDGSGGGRTWRFHYWLWPLPPPGPLAVVLEWPGQGIGLTRAALDTAALLAAAAESQPLWT